AGADAAGTGEQGTDGPGADWEAEAAPEPAEPVRFLDAPQVLVPNRAGIDFVRLFGRSTRFRATTGEHAVPAAVPVLGRWLTYLAGRAEHPGSASLVAMTEALTLHWATGQSALEDANLAALMAWIDPPAGLSGPEAALLAEDPVRWPPAGPATDPQFDNRVLAPAIRAYDAAAAGQAGSGGGDERLGEALAEIQRVARTQLEPTWRLMWRAVDRLRALPAAASAPRRWERDRARFTAYYSYLRDSDGGLPQARRDGAVAAARRLGALERELAEYEADRAFDDPLVLAGHRVTGEAFVGTVVGADRERRRPNERGSLVTRPLVQLRTVDPARLATGTRVRSPARPGQTGVTLAVEPADDGFLVVLELSGGMGRSKVPPPGSVPKVGETLAYTSLLVEGAFSAGLPAPEDTPWTHGGPPSPYEPAEQDARELWE
ncbi:hypothetical protein I6A84_07065, partial [Frankia sp. CNm7]